MGKKALSTLLALAMAVSMICIPASAEATGTALDSAGGELASGSYQLTENVTLAENITIPQGATVTIDLNGYTLTGAAGGGSVITVNGSLTLEDSEGTGAITGGTGTVEKIYAGYLNYALGGGVYVESLSASQPASFTMTGGSITGNACTSSVDTIGFGGGVYITGPNVTFTMTGGAISGNTANMGGGVAVQEAGSGSAVFMMNGGTISGNTAASVGGIVTADGCGGGIYVYSGLVSLATGAVVSGNSAEIGGGIYACGTAQVAVAEATVTANEAGSCAGGIFAYEEVKTYLAGDPTITGNVTEAGEQSNLYLETGAYVTLSGAVTGTVGVTTEETPTDAAAVQITADDANAADSLAAFFSDDDAYTVQENTTDGYLELAVAPTQTEPKATIKSAGLTLDGGIGVNYYVVFSDDVTEAEMADYSMNFTVNGAAADSAEFDSDACRTVSGVKYYRYTVYVTSLQMTANISAELVDGSGETVSSVSTYSVYQYCMNQINKGTEAADVCAALLNYGGYAQEHFGTTLPLANADLTSDLMADWADSNVETYVGAKDNMPAAIESICATLSLESETVIRLYFNLAEGADNVTFTVDGEALEIKTTVSGDAGYGKYSSYVEFKVPANQLSTTYTIAVTDGTNEGTISYSAYAYVNKMVVQGGTASESLKDVCKALYFYGEAAEAYGNWQ